MLNENDVCFINKDGTDIKFRALLYVNEYLKFL